MESTIDSVVFEQNGREQPVIYASFWNRVGALLLDFLIIIPITALSIFNFITFKNIGLLIVLSIIGLLFKPFFEYKYGATPGKMLAKLQITNYEFQKITLQQAILRNIFNIIPAIVSFFVSIALFQKPEFMEATTYMAYVTLAGTDQVQSWSSKITGVIFIVEIIFLLRDDRRRSLHDRIGETVVIKKI